MPSSSVDGSVHCSATTNGAYACCVTISRSHEKRLREIVHEANNPLSIIHNYLHILELRLKDYPETHEQLRLIAAEIRRTAAIFKRVVEFPPMSVTDRGETRTFACSASISTRSRATSSS